MQDFVAALKIPLSDATQLFQCLDLKAERAVHSLCALPSCCSWDNTGKLGMGFTLRIARISKIDILQTSQSRTYF